MAQLGALTQAWVSAHAALPLGWRVTGLMQFGDASGRHAEQALNRLADALRGLRGSANG